MFTAEVIIAVIRFTKLMAAMTAGKAEMDVGPKIPSPCNVAAEFAVAAELLYRA